MKIIEGLKYLRTQSNWGCREFALIREQMANREKSEISEVGHEEVFDGKVETFNC